MQYQIHFDEQHLLFLVTTEGECTITDMLDCLRKLIDHAKWQPGMPFIGDHRKMNIEKFTTAKMEILSDAIVAMNGFFKHSKCAIITNPGVDYGVGRMWQILTEDRMDLKIGIFYSMDDAMQWIEN